MRPSLSHQHKGFTVYAILCGLFDARCVVRALNPYTGSDHSEDAG